MQNNKSFDGTSSSSNNNDLYDDNDDIVIIESGVSQDSNMNIKENNNENINININMNINEKYGSVGNVFVNIFGTSVKRLPGVYRELKRKAFHMNGLMIPALYYLGLKFTDFVNHTSAAMMLGTLTALVWIIEIARLKYPVINQFFLKKFPQLFRPEEHHKLTGTAFYMTGTLITVYFFKPLIAICAIFFLVLGDTAASIVGKAIGAHHIHFLDREREKSHTHRKSIEGFLACFMTSFLIGMLTLYPAEYFDQLSFYGALSAAITEMICDFFFYKVDDNLAIPLVSGTIMTIMAYRFGVPDVSLGVTHDITHYHHHDDSIIISSN